MINFRKNKSVGIALLLLIVIIILYFTPYIVQPDDNRLFVNLSYFYITRDMEMYTNPIYITGMPGLSYEATKNLFMHTFFIPAIICTIVFILAIAYQIFTIIFVRKNPFLLIGSMLILLLPFVYCVFAWIACLPEIASESKFFAGFYINLIAILGLLSYFVYLFANIRKVKNYEYIRE